MSEMESLQAQVSKLADLVNKLQEKLQSQSANLERLVETLDHNTGAFRDTLQILDAKSCVQEAIVRDLAIDVRLLPSEQVAKRTASGALDAEAYFVGWKQQLVREEAKAVDPYAGAVIFGGTDAKVDE